MHICCLQGRIPFQIMSMMLFAVIALLGAAKKQSLAVVGRFSLVCIGHRLRLGPRPLLNPSSAPRACLLLLLLLITPYTGKTARYSKLATQVHKHKPHMGGCCTCCNCLDCRHYRLLGGGVQTPLHAFMAHAACLHEPSVTGSSATQQMCAIDSGQV